MSLNDEERNILISLQLEKAWRNLHEAEKQYLEGGYDFAANRYYYASFHAVQALFLKNNLFSRTHSGMIAQFGLLFLSLIRLIKSMAPFSRVLRL